MKKQNGRTTLKSSKRPARPSGSTSEDTAIPAQTIAQTDLTETSGTERHDANAHRDRSNSGNHFGADGEDRYGGGVRSASQPTGRKAKDTG